jgi:uncharacterized protein (DUF1778 family)
MEKTLKKEKVVSGVSHLKEKSSSMVSLRLNQNEADKVQQAAKDTGRSVAGFVRFAALKYVEELAGQY